MLGFMEKFIVTSLGLELPGWTIVNAPRGRVRLSVVEQALSELVAAYFWSLNQVNTDNQYGIERRSNIAIGRPEAVRRLHLNQTPLLVGLIASMLLMIMNMLLVRPRESRAVGAVDVLDSLGLLQIVWFVRGRPEVLSTVGRVKRPNEAELRHAGMFVVGPSSQRPHSRDGGQRPLSPAPSESSTLTDKRAGDLDEIQLHSIPPSWETFRSR
ncbi:hypothetical protein HDZ31DRAFT_59907 [Schizophyllum fasciatum]